MRWSLILILNLTILQTIFSQQTSPQPSYRQVFGKDYQWAENKIAENQWWGDTLQNHGIDPHLALSVIFPELIRYSAISDFIEVKAIEVLYVQYGSNYANFSIGLFQMKPTFAEQIEADILTLGLAGKYPSLQVLASDTSSTTEARKKRVTRLKDEYGQLLYLEAFQRIMQFTYPETSFTSPENRLEFYAAAYNSAYYNGKEAITISMRQENFHTGYLSPGPHYNYSTIAVYYYRFTNNQQ